MGKRDLMLCNILLQQPIAASSITTVECMYLIGIYWARVEIEGYLGCQCGSFFFFYN